MKIRRITIEKLCNRVVIDAVKMALEFTEDSTRMERYSLDNVPNDHIMIEVIDLYVFIFLDSLSYIRLQTKKQDKMYKHLFSSIGNIFERILKGDKDLIKNEIDHMAMRIKQYQEEEQKAPEVNTYSIGELILSNIHSKEIKDGIMSQMIFIEYDEMKKYYLRILNSYRIV